MLKISRLNLIKFIFLCTTLFLGILQIAPLKQDIYMIQILLYVALAVIGHLRGKQATSFLFSLVEIGITTWLVQQYGLSIIPILLTPVFSYIPTGLSRLQKLIIIGIHLFAINYIMWNETYFLTINIVLLIFIAMVALVAGYHKELSELYQHYDYLKEQHFELNDSKERLVQFAKQVEDVTQVEERSRISQQLHDQLGHRLIRTKMMQEAALQIMPTQSDKAVDLLQQVRDQLSLGLDEMRATVRGLRPFVQVNLIQSLQNLLEELGRETGVQTSLNVQGTPYTLYPSQDLILYRNAQEALTNALKHGRPNKVQVTIEFEKHHVVMSVSNDGYTPNKSEDNELNSHKGLGISGMKERCQLAGGSLSFKLTPHFTVISTLPIHKLPEGN